MIDLIGSSPCAAAPSRCARRVGVPVELRDPADRCLDPHDPLPREHRALLRQPAPRLRQQPRHRSRLAQTIPRADLLAGRSALRPAPVRLVLAGRQPDASRGRAHLPLAGRRAAAGGHRFGRQGRVGQIRQGYGKGQDGRLRPSWSATSFGEEGRYTVRVAVPRRRDRQRRRPVPQFEPSPSACWPVAGAHKPCQIRFGLAPLKKMRAALGAVRRGEADRITGTYPRDIAPLTGEVNLLIETNREILERARTQVPPRSRPKGAALDHRQRGRRLRCPRGADAQDPRAGRGDARSGQLPSGPGAGRGARRHVAPRPRWSRRCRPRAHFGKIYRDKDIAYDVHGAPRPALPRRAPGLRGDGRQPRRQRVEMGPRRVAIRAEAVDKDDIPTSSSPSGDGPGLPPEARQAVLGGGGASTNRSPDPASACRSWPTSPPCTGAVHPGGGSARRPAGGAGGAGRPARRHRDPLRPSASSARGRCEADAPHGPATGPCHRGRVA